jgi:hypothetical protein
MKFSLITDCVILSSAEVSRFGDSVGSKLEEDTKYLLRWFEISVGTRSPLRETPLGHRSYSDNIVEMIYILRSITHRSEASYRIGGTYLGCWRFSVGTRSPLRETPLGVLV